jgi:hypothetical protein
MSPVVFLQGFYSAPRTGREGVDASHLELLRARIVLRSGEDLDE